MSNYDYWASHSFVDSPQVAEKQAIDYLLKGSHNPYPHEIPDFSARVALLALALMGNKEYARTGTGQLSGLADLYQQQPFQTYLSERRAQYHDVLEPSIDLSALPVGSFTISFTFTLTSPYLSRDDTALHLLDNPVKKDWGFKLPYVAATQWKGSLCHALWQMGYQEENEQIRRLFGTVNDNQSENGNRGRLYFYPAFFDRLSLELINPHDRKTGAGSQPILLESVPIGSEATFTLLYTPLDRVGQDEAETCQQVAADLQRVAEGLSALFTVYGFGAKTSSGFGVAGNGVRDGDIVVGGLAYESELSTSETTPSNPPQTNLPRYLSKSNELHPDFISATGELKSEVEYQRLVEERGQKYTKRYKQLYDKAQKWWEQKGKRLAQQPEESELDPEPTPVIPPQYPLACETFDKLADLTTKAQTLAEVLHRPQEVTHERVS